MSLLTTGFASLLALAAGALLLATGIVLLVIGSRRRDDSTSRPLLAFGITALVLGTTLAVPALLWLMAGLLTPA